MCFSTNQIETYSLSFIPTRRFSYLIEFNVCYLVLCDRTYPKNLAFLYLKELQKEFHDNYGQEVDTAARPYAFVKFGTVHT
jgi:vesicle transport protein SEC22